MITAHVGRSVMLSALLSFVLFFHVACVENKEEEKVTPAPQAPSVKPVAPAENDSARKPTQDSVKKPVRMMNYKSFRKSFTLHRRGNIVSLLSKLYRA